MKFNHILSALDFSEIVKHQLFRLVERKGMENQKNYGYSDIIFLLKSMNAVPYYLHKISYYVFSPLIYFWKLLRFLLNTTHAFIYK